MPWAAENLETSLAGVETFNVTLGKDTLTLAPLRSAARSFRELRRKFVTGQTIEALKAFTDETGATAFLLRPPRQDQRPHAPDEPSSETADAEGDASEAGGADASQPQDNGDDGGRKRKRRRRRRGGRGRGDEAGDTSSEASADGPDADGPDADGPDAGDGAGASDDAGEPGDDDAPGDAED